jgi:hypothetical protein
MLIGVYPRHGRHRLRDLGESTKGLGAWFKRAVMNKRTEIEEHLQNNDGAVDYDQLRNDVFTRLNLVNYIDQKLQLSESEIVSLPIRSHC